MRVPAKTEASVRRNDRLPFDGRRSGLLQMAEQISSFCQNIFLPLSD